METDNTDYMKDYYKNNKSKWLSKIECKICNETICRSGRYHHNKSKKHTLTLELLNKNKELNDIKEKMNIITNCINN